MLLVDCLEGPKHTSAYFESVLGNITTALAEEGLGMLHERESLFIMVVLLISLIK